MPQKNWDQIVANLPSPPSSDDEDGPNLVSVQKNAQRVSDALHNLLPMLNSNLAKTVPKGMNRPATLRDDIKKTMDDAVRKEKGETTK